MKHPPEIPSLFVIVEAILFSFRNSVNSTLLIKHNSRYKDIILDKNSFQVKNALKISALEIKLDKEWQKFEDVPATSANAPEMFLDYFYPIHFSIGMKIEAGLMSCGQLDRHQTVIMWILRSEMQRSGETSISRKDIVRLMTNWYDITSSSVSKALRALAKEPLHYIELTEDPNSGREKLVTMTPAGKQHCKTMIASACEVIRRITDNFSDEENRMGVYMFMRMDEEFSASADDH